MLEKEQFLTIWKREFPITLKVLKAFPVEKTDWKPHDKARSAKQLAWTIVSEEIVFGEGALTGKMDFSTMPSAPATYEEILAAYQKNSDALIAKVEGTSEAELVSTMPFPTGPKQMGETRRLDLLWTMLLDSIHHRGQFSVYLRMAGGSVPSIYGPSGDEPWQ